jgi:pimeloyl-ACP methyl ester carboxylesterase
VVDWRGQVVSLLDRCYLVGAIPALVVWGGAGRGHPARARAQRAHEALAGSRLEVFAGAGHFPHHEDPDRFVTVVREFVATTEPQPTTATRGVRRLRRGA